MPRGASLVLVLAALALVSFLALAILTFVRSEDRSARTSADLIEMRLLSDLPEKLVTSQIRRATSQLGMDFTWASQPGMIRVFNTNEPGSDGRHAKPEEVFKLYSSDRMTMSQPSDDDFDVDTKNLQGWAAETARFTDLNEPVIVQPPVKQGRTKPDGDPSIVFPILDPGALDLVDGFSVDKSARSLFTEDSDRLKARLNMPAMWLYVLRDGTVAAPVSSSASSVKVKEANKDNPIVGRIAFWTDDDSCKLNINTATEPSPWQAPLSKTQGDKAAADSIPARNEFYRMSGHPSFTSLAPALRKLGTNDSTKPIDREPETRQATEWWNHLQAWHDLMPRTFTSDSAPDGTQGGRQDATNAVEIKQSRLFATVDELAFKPGLSNSDGRPLFTGSSMAPKLKPEDVRKVEFFLTTHSSAPETNPFNRPKVSLWPVQVSTNERSTIDKAFTAASTLGEDIYFLQRDSLPNASNGGSSQDPDLDANLERNAKLYGYLQDLTERTIPGFGGQFADADSQPGASNKGKYSPQSRDQLLASMFDMVRWGVNPVQPDVPNTGSPLDHAYNFLTVGDGTATNAWSAVPMRFVRDPSSTNLSQHYAKGMGRFPTISEVCIVFMATNARQFGPNFADINNDGWADETTGMQAFVVIEPYVVAPGVPSIAPHFVYRIEGLQTLSVTPQTSNTPKSLSLPADTYSEVWLTPNASLSSLAFDSPNGNAPAFYGGGTSPFTPFLSQFYYFDQTQNGAMPRIPLGNSPVDSFPFLSSTPVTLNNGEGLWTNTLTLSGANDITISIYDADQAYSVNKVPVQRISIDLSPLNGSTIPVPLININRDGNSVLGVTPVNQMLARFKLRRPGDNTTDPNLPGPTETAQLRNLIHAGDVTRSFEPADKPLISDMRLVAAYPEITSQTGSPNNFFRDHPALPLIANQPGVNYRADSLRDGAHMGDGQIGVDMQSPTVEVPPTGRVASNIVVRPTSSSTFQALSHANLSSPGTLAVAMNADFRAGDFDNGPGIIEDGPFINPPGFNGVLNERAAVITNSQQGGWFQRGGYFTDEDGRTWSPWRYASSGFLFGSLPTAPFGLGSDTQLSPRPWQTLLLCPNPPSRTTAANAEPKWDRNTSSPNKDHVGFLNPRDHLWLEFFWLPAVEPKGFGGPFVTEGKVNLNCQMMPFTWITRETALHGALHGVRVTAIPSKAVSTTSTDHYKNPNADSSLSFKYAVNAEETLKGWRRRFEEKHDLYRTPSEVCDLFLVPERINDGRNYTTGNVTPVAITSGLKYDDMMTWWEGSQANDPTDGFEATGDNARESPYAQLYPRLCTKSNVFTVHWRVQVLRKSRSTDPGEWDDGKDRVVAEQRGQSMIERALPPNLGSTPGATLPSDYVTTLAESEAMDDFYEYRIVSRRIFAP